MAFTLTSTAFADGASIPRQHTCDGANQSPQLIWADPPAGTRSFVLIVDDPDAPSGTFTHWVLVDIPASASELSAGQGAGGIGGRNDFGRTGYGGPCPPRGHGVHRYYFRLSALDSPSLNLGRNPTRDSVQDKMRGHVLATAELMGRYERE
jgi:hypothetical protein